MAIRRLSRSHSAVDEAQVEALSDAYAKLLADNDESEEPSNPESQLQLQHILNQYQVSQNSEAQNSKAQTKAQGAGDSQADAAVMASGACDPESGPKSGEKDDQTASGKPQQRKTAPSEPQTDQWLPWSVHVSGPTEPLTRAATEILTALHRSKEELAKEMEANLKQLKAVLKATEQIAKDMESVLREAQSAPDPIPEEASKPGGSNSQRGERWQPPAYGNTAATKGEQTGEESQQGQHETAANGAAAGSKDQPPPWEPPQFPTQDEDQAPQQDVGW